MHSRENLTPTRSRPNQLIKTFCPRTWWSYHYRDLGPLTKRDKLLMQRKLSNHGLGLRSMEANLEFLFLAGFMKTVKSITSAFPHFNPTLASTLSWRRIRVRMGSSWQRHSILWSKLIVKHCWIYYQIQLNCWRNEGRLQLASWRNPARARQHFVRKTR